MSIGFKALKYIEEILEIDKRSIKGSTICCMGHLNTKKCSRDYMRSKGIKGYTVISSYFKHLGAEVIELDLNTKGMALPIDLGREIKDETLFNKFDLIIDGGTAEHIDNQQEYFKNVLRLLKIGGISIHMLPYRNSWDRHATWRYDFDWLDNFIKTQQYQIIDARKFCDGYFNFDFNRLMLAWSMKKTEKTIYNKFINPTFDPQGNIKDKRMYDKILSTARGKS